MKLPARIALGAAIVVVLLGALAFPGHVVYWGSTDKIEAYLLKQTPLSITKEEVLAWLQANGTPGQLSVAHVAANSDYPPTTVGGESFIHKSVASYRAPFRTDIEAFYIFDANGKLADLRVRTTTDAL
jgi:hypothetical protein